MILAQEYMPEVAVNNQVERNSSFRPCMKCADMALRKKPSFLEKATKKPGLREWISPGSQGIGR